MKSSIVAYKPLPADVLAWLREHAQVVEVDATQHDALGAALDGTLHGALHSTLHGRFDAALARNGVNREVLAR